jgi:hypothetical protein
MFRSNFDFQLARAMCAGSYGDGAAVGIGGESLATLFDYIGTFSLPGLEGEMTCPLLSIGGEAEGPLALTAGHEFFEKLTCPKTERVISSAEGGEAHRQINNPALKHHIEFDWLDDVFTKNQGTRGQ